LSQLQQEHIRATILTGLHAGRTVREIVQFCNLSEATVRRVRHNFNKFIGEGDKEEE